MSWHVPIQVILGTSGIVVYFTVFKGPKALIAQFPQQEFRPLGQFRYNPTRKKAAEPPPTTPNESLPAWYVPLQ